MITIRTSTAMLVLAAAFLAALLIVGHRTSQAAPRIAWEYKVVAMPSAGLNSGQPYRDTNERLLTSLGTDGWELVDVIPAQLAGDLRDPFVAGVVYVLKRQR